MLSKGDFQKLRDELTEAKDYCKAMRLGSNNLKNKFNDSSFFDNNGFSKLKAIAAKTAHDSLTDKTNVASFLIYIAEFERIFYQIFIKELSGYNDSFSKDRDANNFIDVFIKVRAKNDFYPLSEIKSVITKISQIDLNYMNEIISLRNYYAHGKKEDDDLLITRHKKEKADKNLINNLDDLNKRLVDVLEKLISKP